MLGFLYYVVAIMIAHRADDRLSVGFHLMGLFVQVTLTLPETAVTGRLFRPFYKRPNAEYQAELEEKVRQFVP